MALTLVMRASGSNWLQNSCYGSGPIKPLFQISHPSPTNPNHNRVTNHNSNRNHNPNPNPKPKRNTSLTITHQIKTHCRDVRSDWSLRNVAET